MVCACLERVLPQARGHAASIACLHASARAANCTAANRLTGISRRQSVSNGSAMRATAPACLLVIAPALRMRSTCSSSVAAPGCPSCVSTVANLHRPLLALWPLERRCIPAKAVYPARANGRKSSTPTLLSDRGAGAVNAIQDGVRVICATPVHTR